MNTQTSRISQDETGLGSLSCVHGADRLAYAPYALGWDVCSVCRRAYPRAACPTPPCRPFQEGGDIASPGYMSRASVGERAVWRGMSCSHDFAVQSIRRMRGC